MNPRDRHPSRRGVLSGIAATALLPVLPRAWAQTSAPAPLPSNPDVVIVGAGAAGLSAARTLIVAGRSVVILEAMNRIGGRAFTEKETFGVEFDWGCAWIHSSKKNPFDRLAKQWRYETFEHQVEHDRIYYGFEARPFSRRERRAAEHEEVRIKNVVKLAAQERDGAVSSVVTVTTPAQHVAATTIGPLDMAVDFNALSIRDYAEQAELEPNLLVRKGFGTIVRQLGNNLPVSLGTPATRIRYAGPGVVVETEKGDVRGRACIVTASTGVLASGSIQFDPPLPLWMQTAIADVPMGLLAKIPLLTDGARFDLRPFDDVHLELPGLQDIYFLAFPFKTNMLIGFVGGAFAWELSKAGKDAAVDFAIQSVRRMFGARAGNRIVKADFTRWAGNSWTRGAYSAALPGRFAARAELERPVADRIFLAGEALGREFAQTAGGAYLSGERAAQAVLRALV